MTHQEPVGGILTNSYQCLKKKKTVLLKYLPHPSVGLKGRTDLSGHVREDFADETGHRKSVSRGMRKALLPADWGDDLSRVTKSVTPQRCQNTVEC